MVFGFFYIFKDRNHLYLPGNYISSFTYQHDMYARVIQFSVLPEFISEATVYFKSTIGPALKEQKGFVSSRLLINDTTYQCMTVTLWESQQTLHASESSIYLKEILDQMLPYIAIKPLIGYYANAADIG